MNAPEENKKPTMDDSADMLRCQPCSIIFADMENGSPSSAEDVCAEKRRAESPLIEPVNKKIATGPVDDLISLTIPMPEKEEDSGRPDMLEGMKNFGSESAEEEEVEIVRTPGEMVQDDFNKLNPHIQGRTAVIELQKSASHRALCRAKWCVIEERGGGRYIQDRHRFMIVYGRRARYEWYPVLHYLHVACMDIILDIPRLLPNHLYLAINMTKAPFLRAWLEKLGLVDLEKEAAYLKSYNEWNERDMERHFKHTSCKDEDCACPAKETKPQREEYTVDEEDAVQLTDVLLFWDKHCGKEYEDTEFIARIMRTRFETEIAGPV